MKTIFFGTSDFAATILKELNDIDLVVTQPDQPQGRKKTLTPPPVKTLAAQKNISVLQPPKLNSDFIQKIKDLKPDLFIVAAYGNLLPKALLAIPKHGALNVHPSLLPKYRGPSPIQTTLLNNDQQTGLTIIQMDEKMDHGPIIAQEKISVDVKDNYQLLADKLARLAAKMLIKIIPQYLSHNITPIKQNHDQATFTKIITKQDGLITPDMSAQKIYHMLRAYTPWPGIYLVNKTKLLDVEIKNNLLKINRLQPAGKKEMDAKSYINGYLKSKPQDLFISELF